jgi:23S rRNA pseudoU1915 N3-methylase RlmH
MREKKFPESIQIKKEGEKILSILKKNELIILLDENGEHKSSVGFSKFIQKKTKLRNKNYQLHCRWSLWVFKRNKSYI